MILKQGKAIFPASTEAFEVSQSSEKELNREYKGAIVLWKDGQQRIIASIKDKGLKGDTFLQKLHSALFGVKNINVSFANDDKFELSGLKKLVTDCLTTDQELAEPFFELRQPLEKVCERVKEASSVQEIVGVIDLPTPNDCLDVL